MLQDVSINLRTTKLLQCKEHAMQKPFIQRQSLNKITHSYIAQYTITMSGKLSPFVFLCLQEARSFRTQSIKNCRRINKNL